MFFLLQDFLREKDDLATDEELNIVDVCDIWICIRAGNIDHVDLF